MHACTCCALPCWRMHACKHPLTHTCAHDHTTPADLLELLAGSSVGLVTSIGGVAADEMEGQRGGQTVSSRFTGQLRELVAMLDATGLHFVRCIKPNASLAPGRFTSELVLQQLRCCGVLEVARVSRAGFPTRYLHAHFVDRYKILLPKEQQAAMGSAAAGAGADVQRAVLDLLGVFKVPPGQYEMGRSKVFFRPGERAGRCACGACLLRMLPAVGLACGSRALWSSRVVADTSHAAAAHLATHACTPAARRAGVRRRHVGQDAGGGAEAAGVQPHAPRAPPLPPLAGRGAAVPGRLARPRRAAGVWRGAAAAPRGGDDPAPRQGPRGGAAVPAGERGRKRQRG